MAAFSSVSRADHPPGAQQGAANVGPQQQEALPWPLPAPAATEGRPSDPRGFAVIPVTQGGSPCHLLGPSALAQPPTAAQGAISWPRRSGVVVWPGTVPSRRAPVSFSRPLQPLQAPPRPAAAQAGSATSALLGVLFFHTICSLLDLHILHVNHQRVYLTDPVRLSRASKASLNCSGWMLAGQEASTLCRPQGPAPSRLEGRHRPRRRSASRPLLLEALPCRGFPCNEGPLPA